MMPSFKPGDLVTVKGFRGYAKIISIEPLGENYKVDLFYPEEKTTHTVIYPLTGVEKICTPIEMIKSRKFDPSWKFNLFMDAMRFSLAHQYDPFFSLSITRIDVLPHQIEAVYKMIDSYEQRFLLADDAGLGKTVMAGMIIKELEARNRANRTLIVVPAPLQGQWRREMLESFDEQFFIYSSEFVRSLKESLPPFANPWEKYNKIITSIDYAKREEVMSSLERSNWDLVIFDEAHHLSAYKYGSEIKRSDRYKLAELLKDKTEGLLFLTATPHKGDSYAFYAILSLLDPYIFLDENHIEREKLKRIMIRRLKEDVTDFDGKLLFLPRKVQTLSVDFTDSERRLYDAVTDYVSQWYNIAKETGNRNVGFAMVILQKRMVSSIAAIKQSLKNRKDKLKNLLKIGEEATEISTEEKELLKRYFADPESLDDPDSFTDDEKERIEKRIEVITVAKSADELKMEIKKLEELIYLAESIKVDSKANKLVEFIEGILKKDSREKILIFTEYRDTLNYLKNIFKNYDLAIIHGGIDYQKRREQEKKFWDPRTNLMIATDAAREGINLQFAHIMIDYELPWNPNRIEQRMGRLHRYGQNKVVQIFNLLVSNTREGEIFGKLMEKLELIRAEMGERVFDVLGILLSNTPLQDLIMKALTKRDVREVYKVVDKNIEENKKSLFEKIETKSLIRDRLNLAPLIEQQTTSREKSLNEKDMERFIRTFFDHFGGKIKKSKEGIFSLKVPGTIADNETINTKYSVVTFSREIAKNLGKYNVEFVAIGHPIIDRIIRLSKEPTFGGKVAVKIDPSNRSGVIFNYLMRTMDGNGKTVNERLCTFFVNLENEDIAEVDTKVIWEFEDFADKFDGETTKYINNVIERIDVMQKKTEGEAVKRIEDALNKAKERRKHDINIKNKDAEEYFDKRIKISKKRIDKYVSRSFLEDMSIAIRGEETKIKNYKEKLREVEENLKREGSILPEAPELLSIAIVLPKNKVLYKGGQIDEETKRIVESEGMKLVMDYEKRQQRMPNDVSKEFRGYDIKSTGKHETRYIEVKAFAESGIVEMTENEWIMATKLKENYWLYVVEHVMQPEKRRLNLIQNPSEKFKKYEIIPTQIRIKIKNWQDSVDSIVMNEGIKTHLQSENRCGAGD